jgi:hypothetical protein
MQEAATIWVIFGLVFAASLGISWGLSRWFGSKGWPSGGRVLAAGIAPMMLLIATLWVWDKVARAQLSTMEQQEGYMGPLLLLLYGFPFLVIMLVANVLAAIAALRKP